mgnify:CR=1 FL=1
MSSQVDTSMPRSYTDFTGLGELRGKAQKDQNSALRESAQQFEGLFIQMMLKSMREANEPMKDEENKSHALETFEGMFDKEVSLQMSKRGALGVAAAAAWKIRQIKASRAPAMAPAGGAAPTVAMDPDSPFQATVENRGAAPGPAPWRPRQAWQQCQPLARPAARHRAVPPVPPYTATRALYDAGHSLSMLRLPLCIPQGQGSAAGAGGPRRGAAA